MLDNIGGTGFLILILLAIFLWGPDKLPQALANLRTFIAKARQMASNAAADLSREIGTDIKPEDLNPKTFVRKHVLSEADQELLTNPLKATMRDLQDSAKPLEDELKSAARGLDETRRNVNGQKPSGNGAKPANGAATGKAEAAEPAANRFDDVT